MSSAHLQPPPASELGRELMRQTYSWGAFAAWVISMRFLYPLPVDMGLDLARWSIYMVMIALGLHASWSLIRSFNKSAFTCLTIAAAIYLLLRTLYYDSIIYISLWHAIFDVPRDIGSVYLMLGGDALHVVQTVVLSLIVPFVLLGSWIGILYSQAIRSGSPGTN